MRPGRLVAIPMAASLILLAVPATPSTADATSTQTIIVTMDSAKGATQAAEDAVAAAGGTVTAAHAIGGRAVAVTLSGVSASGAKKIGEATADQTGVTAAQKSQRFYATTTSDTDYSYLWNLNNADGSTYGVDAEDAWGTSTGSGAYVAVIDSGITAHSDLNGGSGTITGGNLVAGYDFVSDSSQSGDGDGYDADPTDVVASNEYHGTHVAGIVAAMRNDKGVVGVAPDAKVQPIRVLGTNGGSEEDIIAAIRWAAGLSVPGVATNPTPAAAINLSLGGDGSCSYALQNAIDAAAAAGTAVVVAAGNADDSGRTEPIANITPANCANVIRVTASTNVGTLAWYSDYGTSAVPATIAAPGGSATSNSDADPTHWIISTWYEDGAETYTGMIGTSMATPHVSGVIALLKAKWPNLTVAQMVALLAATAKPVSGGCAAARCGAGIVNAAAAVASAGTAGSVSVSVGTPSIVGTGKVGSTLYAASTGYTPATGEVSWQWLRNGVAIPGATSQAYAAVAADSGTSLAVRETVRYFDVAASATSAAKVAYRYTFSSLSRPKIKGTYKVGHKLKVKAGTAKPSATGKTYQWLRGGTVIAGATGSSYVVVAADRKQKISVKVTVSRSGYANRSATSAAHKVK